MPRCLEKKLSKRRLEILLERVPPPPKPKVEYEQYLIPATLASRILWTAHMAYGDIEGKLVLDLGAGTGRLGIGAAMLGAEYVVGVDVDLDSLVVAREVSEELGVHNADFVACDVAALELAGEFDTVLQNPPFGVHRRGADILFLEKAAELGGVVYSIHKAETEEYVLRQIERLGMRPEVLFYDEVPIPPVYPFHTERVHLVKVFVMRAVRQGRVLGR